jgi:hypothetical protein
VTPRGQDEQKVYRITGAPRSHTEDINRRINRYLVSMTVRTACVVLIFVLHGPGRWVAAAGAIFLPWVAVMMANAADRRVSVQLPPMVLDHRALMTGAEPEGPAPTVLDGEVVNADGSPVAEAPPSSASTSSSPPEPAPEASSSEPGAPDAPARESGAPAAEAPTPSADNVR